jgi:hypothetical protein
MWPVFVISDGWHHLIGDYDRGAARINVWHERHGRGQAIIYAPSPDKAATAVTKQYGDAPLKELGQWLYAFNVTEPGSAE